VSHTGGMKLKIQILSAKTEHEGVMSVGSPSARVMVEKRVRSCKAGSQQGAGRDGAKGSRR
jgi:hypothetical protein